MANIEVTNNATFGPVIWEPVFKKETITFAGADTFVAGTILARKAVNDAVAVAADGGNTGDGTVTNATVAAGQIVPIVGAYNLEVTAAATNGGTLKLEDPNGALIANELVMTAGAGAATTFEVGGLEFTVTDGATDFVVGDKFTLTVAANGKLVLFATDGAGGAQIPKAVLTQELTATGAGDVVSKVMVGGQVRRGDLVIDADGDASNVDAAVTDQLRDYGIVARETLQLGELDNQ